jgi:hypothetical protein
MTPRDGVAIARGLADGGELVVQGAQLRLPGAQRLQLIVAFVIELALGVDERLVLGVKRRDHRANA